jgi:hypothetical protein
MQCNPRANPREGVARRGNGGAGRRPPRTRSYLLETLIFFG